MNIENLNSQESLERLASYIVRAANQSLILDDEHTVTDSTWSSKKIQDTLDDISDENGTKYVAITQGTAFSNKFLQVNTDGDVEPKDITFENSNIDFSHDF